jgi:hypothetical protein
MSNRSEYALRVPGGEVIKHPRDSMEQFGYLSAVDNWGPNAYAKPDLVRALGG